MSARGHIDPNSFPESKSPVVRYLPLRDKEVDQELAEGSEVIRLTNLNADLQTVNETLSEKNLVLQEIVSSLKNQNDVLKISFRTIRAWGEEKRAMYRREQAYARKFAVWMMVGWVVAMFLLFTMMAKADGISYADKRKPLARRHTTKKAIKKETPVPLIADSTETLVEWTDTPQLAVLPFAHADIELPPLSGSNLNAGIDALTGPLEISGDSPLPWFALALIPLAAFIPDAGGPPDSVLPPVPPDTKPVPEESTVGLFALGLFALGWAGRGRLLR